MARIAGIDIPKTERVEVGLTRVFGVGRSSSRKILSETGVDPNIRVKDLSDDELSEMILMLEALSYALIKKVPKFTKDY